MRQIIPQQHNFIRFFLNYKGEDIEVMAPDNYDVAQKEYTRSIQYHGMMISLSDSVIFSGETAQLLKNIYDQDGVIARVTFSSYVKNDESDDWELEFTGELDFLTYSYNGGNLSLKINSNNLIKKLQSRYQTEIDIDNSINLDGIDMNLGITERISVNMFDRQLQGQALLSTGNGYLLTYTQGSLVSVLLTNLNEGEYGGPPATYAIGRENFTQSSPELDNFFFYNQQDVETLALEFNVTFNALFSSSTELFGAELFLRFYKYDFDDDGVPIFNAIDELEKFTFNGTGEFEMNFQKTFTYTVTRKQGLIFAILKGGSFPQIHNDINIKSSSIDFWAKTFAPGTINEAILPFPFFERMAYHIGAKKFESSYLEASRLSLATGFMIRNVTPRKPVSITFQKLYNSFDSIRPLGLSVDSGKIIVEERGFFYQTFDAFYFDQIDNIEYKFDAQVAYSEINIGFETSNFSQEAALNEYAVRTTWVSPVNTHKKELNMVSSIQASSNTIETLRRVQYIDTIQRTYERRGDSTLFFIDLKDYENKPRTWQDDFEKIPYSNKGGPRPFNPSGAYNLRISPMNTLRNIGAWVNHAYTKFPDKKLTFASSTGDTGMITKPIGEPEMAEDDSILIGDMDTPKFISETVTFNFKPFNLTKILNEKVNGIKKQYGIFSFKDGEEVKKGYLISYKPENYEIQLQLIK